MKKIAKDLHLACREKEKDDCVFFWIWFRVLFPLCRLCAFWEYLPIHERENQLEVERQCQPLIDDGHERVVDLDNGCVGERLNHFVHAVPSDFAVVCDIHKRRRNGVEDAQRSGVWCTMEHGLWNRCATASVFCVLLLGDGFCSWWKMLEFEDNEREVKEIDKWICHFLLNTIGVPRRRTVASLGSRRINERESARSTIMVNILCLPWISWTTRKGCPLLQVVAFPWMCLLQTLPILLARTHSLTFPDICWVKVWIF